jgi:hypothetical protein
MKELTDSKEYKKFLKSIKERIYRAQYAALKKVNKEHIALCWYIGKKIVEKQQAHNWGKAIIKQS